MEFSCSELENPLGIETAHDNIIAMYLSCCSELENPLGIETVCDVCARPKRRGVAASLKTH